MRVCVIGMGYVGCVTAACLAEEGHTVTGVDVAEEKLKALLKGEAPVDEPGLAPLIKEAVGAGRLSVTADVATAVRDADASLICVGTPSAANGRLDLSHVERVCGEVGRALAQREPGHVVVIRSTMLPGSMASLVRPTLEKASGKQDGVDFFTVFNPEFLREGTAIQDYHKPPVVVAGSEHPHAVDLMRRLYERTDAPFVATASSVAEMVKYTANVWHALKITFANEIAEVCRAAGVDSHAVMDIFLQDRHLNVSPAYLRPGFAFGGSCLPKDVRALTYFARHHDVNVPVLDHICASNQALIERTFQRVLALGFKRVGLYGLSFKPKTDDLRESPFVVLAERLIGKGIGVRIFDENIQPARLTGTNKAYIDAHLPHMTQYLVADFAALEELSDVVVVGHKTAAVAAWAHARPSRIKILDLVHMDDAVAIPNCEDLYQ